MNKDQYIQVDFSQHDIEVHAKNVADLMGYPLTSDDHLDGTIHSLIDKGYELIRPYGAYIVKRIDKLDIKKGVLSISKTKFNIGRIIASQLKYAEYAALFISTIGKEIEAESKKMQQVGDLFEGYTLDLIGSEAAEFVAESVHKKIKCGSLENGFNTSNRFSPGYCDWNVKEQYLLFNFFNDNNTKISLNDSALMNPIKSVSGLIGIGKDVVYQSYNCSKCTDEKCIYRNKKSK